MAKYLVDSFEKNVELFDLQKNPLPMCDGDDCYDLPEVLDFREKVKNAEGCSTTRYSGFCVPQVGETATCP